MAYIDHLSNWPQQPSLAARLCPGLVRDRHLRLEIVSQEEMTIRNLERKISDGRKQGQPMDAFIKEREKTVESWIERLEREAEKTTDGPARESLKRQRERVISEYRGSIQ